MMNLDMARAGGEGVVSSKKNKNVELGDDGNANGNNAISSGSSLLEGEDIPLRVSVPEGWRMDDNAS